MNTKGLPDLTTGQYDFMCGVLAGMTGADAYREAYNTENWGNNAIWVQASKMKAHPKIVLWMNRAREAVARKAERTAEAHMNRLTELQGMALKGKQYGAAVRTEELIGKVSGHYVERIRNETPDPVQDAQSALLAHVDSVSPEAGKLLREAMLKGTGRAVSA